MDYYGRSQAMTVGACIWCVDTDPALRNSTACDGPICMTRSHLQIIVIIRLEQLSVTPRSLIYLDWRVLLTVVPHDCACSAGGKQDAQPL